MTHREWFESMDTVLWKATWQEGQRNAKELPNQIDEALDEEYSVALDEDNEDTHDALLSPPTTLPGWLCSPARMGQMSTSPRRRLVPSASCFPGILTP
jgi:hypothetical protein